VPADAGDVIGEASLVRRGDAKATYATTEMQDSAHGKI